MLKETQKIVNYFQNLDAKKGNIVRETSKGIFGTSDLEVIETFFENISLTNKYYFVDIGSGDGRVVILASKYTKAVGIEIDEELIKESKEHANILQSKAEFICKDYEDYSYENVDVIFSFADHFFTKTFLEKLKKEFKGTLYVYEGVFLPEEIKKGPTIWINQTKIISYQFAKE
jgi:cyclopropane fatty-acyl-phospholipid synthase-like methyltransferase